MGDTTTEETFATITEILHEDGVDDRIVEGRGFGEDRGEGEEARGNVSVDGDDEYTHRVGGPSHEECCDQYHTHDALLSFRRFSHVHDLWVK